MMKKKLSYNGKEYLITIEGNDLRIYEIKKHRFFTNRKCVYYDYIFFMLDSVDENDPNYYELICKNAFTCFIKRQERNNEEKALKRKQEENFHKWDGVIEFKKKKNSHETI